MIQRERYMQEIRDFMDKPVVKIITGMRRCGKSALLELTREELRRRGVQEQNIISMNFESLRYEAFKDYRALYQEVCKRADRAQGKVYILLDEIQEVDSWEQGISGNIWILPRRIQRRPPWPSRSSLPISCGLEVFLGFIR